MQQTALTTDNNLIIKPLEIKHPVVMTKLQHNQSNVLSSHAKWSIKHSGHRLHTQSGIPRPQATQSIKNSEHRLILTSSQFLIYRVRTILALGYWVLPIIFQYWVVLGIGQYFYCLSYPIPILLGHLDTSCQQMTAGTLGRR